jgi:hypothetical protein
VKGLLRSWRDRRPARTIARGVNTLAAPDPQFDAQFVPRAPQCTAAGYRPAVVR